MLPFRDPALTNVTLWPYRLRVMTNYQFDYGTCQDNPECGHSNLT